MPDQSVVEELLEKGARALAEYDGDSWDYCPEEDRNVARALFAVGLDAVFPGWREGITREFAWRDERYGFLQRSPHDLLATRSLCGDRDVVVQRWVGPWAPVEDGEK